MNRWAIIRRPLGTPLRRTSFVMPVLYSAEPGARDLHVVRVLLEADVAAGERTTTPGLSEPNRAHRLTSAARPSDSCCYEREPILEPTLAIFVGIPVYSLHFYRVQYERVAIQTVLQAPEKVLKAPLAIDRIRDGLLLRCQERHFKWFAHCATSTLPQERQAYDGMCGFQAALGSRAGPPASRVPRRSSAALTYLLLISKPT